MAYKRISPQPVIEGGTGAQTLTAHGVLLGEGTSAIAATAVGTTGQVLTGVTGGDPTFQALPAGGASTFHTGSGDATASAGAITIAGTTNQISTSGSGATVTIAVPSSPSFGGTTTVATGLTATTGNITATAGNIVLPTTTSTTGQIVVNSLPFIHSYGTANFFAGSTTANFTLSGNNDVGVGFNVLPALTSGSNNVCVGSQSGLGLTSGNTNTLIGNGAAYQVVSGSSNICIGSVAGFAYSTGESSNICIGNPGVVGESNVIRLGTNGSGSAQQSTCFIAGITGVTVGVSGVPVVIDNTGNLGTVVSSIRFKKNIEEIDETSVLDLTPVSFTYKSDKTDSVNYGLIAEDVEDVMPELVSYDLEGLPSSVKYQDLPVLLLAELKRLSKRVEDLELLTRGEE